MIVKVVFDSLSVYVEGRLGEMRLLYISLQWGFLSYVFGNMLILSIYFFPWGFRCWGVRFQVLRCSARLFSKLYVCASVFGCTKWKYSLFQVVVVELQNIMMMEYFGMLWSVVWSVRPREVCMWSLVVLVQVWLTWVLALIAEVVSYLWKRGDVFRYSFGS